jgi:hypothetical protein
MYYITCDVDWAPEVVLDDFLNILETHNVKCTLFATHESKILKDCNKSLFEIGIHPNYNFLLNGNSNKSRNQILADLLKCYPSAKGVRSHSLTQSSNILQDFVDHNLKYDMNLFLPYQKINEPFKWFNGLLRVMYNWEDDIHFLNNYSFNECRLDENDKLNILDFHPIHVYLNTDTVGLYNSAKEFYNQPEKLYSLRNKKNPGTRDLFISIIKKITHSETISELVSRYE